jgi:sulfatase modifying factor 1
MKRTIVSFSRLPSMVFCVGVAALLGSLTVPARAVTIDTVTVGDPGNANDDTGYGAVGYEYRIGKYEVTIQQYTDFLNAAAKSDPYALWNASMESEVNIVGISRSGDSGSFIYSVIGPSGITPAGASSPGNRPIAYVSWFDAARFANWMHNGQGAGGTETGAYTLVGGQTSGTAPAKNLGAQFYIPTENEWYKAAYYKGGGTNAGYWDYATQSDTASGNTIGSGANQANYYAGDYAVTQSASYSGSQNYLTDVGAFSSSASAYGTFDQSGNVWEWNDLDGTAGSSRVIRGGGCFSVGEVNLLSSTRHTLDPSFEGDYGFRLVASPVAVPEPSTYAMALAGLGCAGYSMMRRRKQA